MDEMEKYFTGEVLYGDDFSEDEIKQWYSQEAEAYANLYGNNMAEGSSYGYNQLNVFYGYSHLKACQTFDKALGFGASWGYEFMPIIDKIKSLDIIESSTQTISTQLGNIVPKYTVPNVKGDIDFSDNTFNLITCFDTLHHIPNVSFVLKELFRVLKPGGYMLLREPIHSMGDWRDKRIGLTKNERGIPLLYFSKIILDSKIDIIEKHYYSCMTSYFNRIFNGSRFLNTKAYLYIDKYLSKLFAFNVHYHETNKLQRIAPISIFYVLRKPLE